MKSWQYSAVTLTLILVLENNYSVMLYSLYSRAVMMTGHPMGLVISFNENLLLCSTLF